MSLGSILRRSEAVLGRLGDVLKALEGLGPFWGPFWNNFGDQIEAILEPLSGPFLGPVFHCFSDYFWRQN